MSVVEKAACIGGGVIGAAWAARFSANGIDVVIVDPDPEAPRKVDEVMRLARRAQSKLTLAPLGRQGSVRVTTDLAEALAGAQFIQEAAPERIELKRRLFADIEALVPREVVIASSTSGYKPSDLQEGMRHPERLLVGHPFNPVYLLPLVEIVPSPATSPAVTANTKSFYASLGMHPLVVRKEIDAFIADRLMEALWREALWLVHDDIATAAEIDDAIRFGCGLRWAQMGTFQVFNIAGGEAGMRHFMAQFGPALKWPWTKLMDTPEMTDELVEKIAVQCEEQAAGLSIRELERIRDDNLIAIMQALRQNRWGAGKTLSEYEAGLLARTHAAAADAGSHDISRPLRLYEDQVRPDWTDYNNHMNESRYLETFTNATDAMMRFVGADEAYIDAGRSYFTGETHIIHKDEVQALEPIYVTTQVLGADDKRMHLFHRLYNGRNDALLATGEHMLLHVDLKARRVTPAAPEVEARLRAVAEAHAALPRPLEAGRHVGAPRA